MAVGFWIFLFIALVGGSLAGERIRALLLEGFAFFWRNKHSPVFSRSMSLTEQSSGIPVIGKRLDGFASVLLVAGGEDAGIAVGDRVIAHDDEYVGHVKQVSLHISQVVLASNAGERFPGWLPVLSTPIELTGLGSGLLRALVPASFRIEVGDEIWYDARLDAFVGDVISVQDTPASPTIQGGQTTESEGLKEIFVRHAVNSLMLSFVRVHP